MSNHITSTSLGSRINCANSSTSPVHKSFFQSSSPITTTTILPDGRVERRLETCSYQETEMVNKKVVCLSICFDNCFVLVNYSDFDGCPVLVLRPSLRSPNPPAQLELLLLFNIPMTTTKATVKFVFKCFKKQEKAFSSENGLHFLSSINTTYFHDKQTLDKTLQKLHNTPRYTRRYI